MVDLAHERAQWKLCSTVKIGLYYFILLIYEIHLHHIRFMDSSERVGSPVFTWTILVFVYVCICLFTYTICGVTFFRNGGS
jgi:hypothetical protein